MQDSSPRQPVERQSIWSVPGHLGRWYGGIFAFQYLVFLGLTIWDELAHGASENTVQLILAVQRGMTANILNIAASTYVALEGVMLAQWLRERDKRKEEEAEERVRQWEAWHERMQEAQQAGQPFDEPPPGQQDQRQRRRNRAQR